MLCWDMGQENKLLFLQKFKKLNAFVQLQTMLGSDISAQIVNLFGSENPSKQNNCGYCAFYSSYFINKISPPHVEVTAVVLTLNLPGGIAS